MNVSARRQTRRTTPLTCSCESARPRFSNPTRSESSFKPPGRSFALHSHRPSRKGMANDDLPHYRPSMQRELPHTCYCSAAPRWTIEVPERVEEVHQALPGKPRVLIVRRLEWCGEECVVRHLPGSEREDDNVKPPWERPK